MRLEDYALIGDTQTAALVSIEGGIDWMCLPRFDSGACFAALLGDEANGSWRLGPATGGRASSRRYLDETLVLETVFTTETGTVRVVDCMPIRGEAPDVVRMVEGLSGRVEMRMDLTIRFDYGRSVPWMRRTETPSGLWPAPMRSTSGRRPGPTGRVCPPWPSSSSTPVRRCRSS